MHVPGLQIKYWWKNGQHHISIRSYVVEIFAKTKFENLSILSIFSLIKISYHMVIHLSHSNRTYTAWPLYLVMWSWRVTRTIYNHPTTCGYLVGLRNKKTLPTTCTRFNSCLLIWISTIVMHNVNYQMWANLVIKLDWWYNMIFTIEWNAAYPHCCHDWMFRHFKIHWISSRS